LSEGDKNLITGWSETESWGVWSNGTIDLLEHEKNSYTFLIEFIFDELSTPRKEFGAEDDRQLGFALKEIELIS
jgi:hypothetical protein